MNHASPISTGMAAGSTVKYATAGLSPVAKAFSDWSQATNEYNCLPFESPETNQAFDATWLPALLTVAREPCRSLGDLRLKLHAFEHDAFPDDDRGLLASISAEIERLAGPDAVYDALIHAAPAYAPPRHFRMTKKRTGLLHAIRDGSKARGVAWVRENIFAVYGIKPCRDLTTVQLAEIAAKLDSPSE